VTPENCPDAVIVFGSIGGHKGHEDELTLLNKSSKTPDLKVKRVFYIMFILWSPLAEQVAFP
jgi:hypothetical protein